MKANWFRLQSVLDLRASALEEAQNILGQALADLAEAQNARDVANREADAVATRICSASGTQTVICLQATRESFLFLAREAQNLQGRVRECELIVQQRRMQLLKASRDHEILVRLKEKWLKVATCLEARKEENILNDLMNSRRFQSVRQGVEEFRLN